MKFLKKILIILVIFLLLLTTALINIFAHYSTKHLVSPPRRELQDYHSTWLETPAKQGIRIDKVLLHNNQIPCLVVNPDGQPAKRGALLRKQMNDRNVPLPTFGKISGQLIILHGRSSRKEDMLPLAERFCAIGLRCLIPDLPGHGENPAKVIGFGAAEGEDQLIANIYQDAIDSQLLSDSLPISILGMSMGGAYAVKTAQKNPIWKSVTILCSFDSLNSIIDSQSNKRFGPLGAIFGSMVKKRAKSMTGIDIDSITPKTWATEIDTPVLIAHGAKDELISINNGKTLFESFASAEKQWLEVPDAQHSNILVTPTQVFAPIAQWILRHHSIIR